MSCAIRFAAPVAVFCALAAATPAVGADLEVTVRGVAHGKGAVKAALYGDPATFRKEEMAQSRQSRHAQAGDAVFVFSGLADGRYAVIVYHDENDNGQMDRFLGMIPTEGYGLSNNPEVSGPPQFDPSAIAVAGDQPVRTAIELRY